MVDFYRTFYAAKHLTLDNLKEAVQAGALSREDYKDITGKAYRQPAKN